MLLANADLFKSFFCVEPIKYFYSKAEFESFLKETTSSFQVLPTSDLNLFKVNENWKTFNGDYQYSLPFIRECCRLLCSSSSTVLFDFLGIVEGPDVPNKYPNPNAARTFFNLLLEERREVLSSYDLLVDTKNKILIGFLSKQHIAEVNVVDIFREVDRNCTRLKSPNFNYAAWSGNTFWTSYTENVLAQSSDAVSVICSPGVYGVFGIVKGSGVRCTQSLCFDNYSLLDTFRLSGHGSRGHTKKFQKKLEYAFDVGACYNFNTAVETKFKQSRGIKLYDMFPQWFELLDSTINDKRRRKLLAELESVAAYKDVKHIFVKAFNIGCSSHVNPEDVSLYDYILVSAMLARELPLLKEEHVMVSLFDLLRG